MPFICSASPEALKLFPGARHVRTNVIPKEIKYDIALPF
jgi:hypothetical protein